MLDEIFLASMFFLNIRREFLDGKRLEAPGEKNRRSLRIRQVSLCCFDVLRSFAPW